MNVWSRTREALIAANECVNGDHASCGPRAMPTVSLALVAWTTLM
jgi:hypothetical protein